MDNDAAQHGGRDWTGLDRDGPGQGQDWTTTLHNMKDGTGRDWTGTGLDKDGTDGSAAQGVTFAQF